MKDDGYAVIRIKKETKDLIDHHKEKTGKLLWYILDEAVKKYVHNASNSKETR